MWHGGVLWDNSCQGGGLFELQNGVGCFRSYHLGSSYSLGLAPFDTCSGSHVLQRAHLHADLPKLGGHFGETNTSY